MATAGCGSHSCQIVDRFGGIVAAAETLVTVEWSRVLDDTSTARVVINPDGDCCANLDQVRSWRHKLAIYRDGVFVWEGPILQVNWNLGQVEVKSGDLLAWLDRRVPHHDIVFTAAELTDIATWLIEDAFRPDDPGHEIEVVGPTRIRGDRTYQIDVDQTGDHLRNLAATGLDFTVIGSKIVLLPEDHAVSVGSLTDADMPDGLTVSEDGTSLATRWVVHGDDETGIVGAAGGTDSYYGLLERTSDETSILDNASAAAAARSRLNASLPVPVFISTDKVTISPDANIDVASLVPGWCLHVSTTVTCRTVSQLMKITGVQVTEDGAGESVQVQLAPVGTGMGTGTGF